MPQVGRLLGLIFSKHKLQSCTNYFLLVRNFASADLQSLGNAVELLGRANVSMYRICKLVCLSFLQHVWGITYAFCMCLYNN